jgi:hypothetical protein
MKGALALCCLGLALVLGVVAPSAAVSRVPSFAASKRYAVPLANGCGRCVESIAVGECLRAFSIRRPRRRRDIRTAYRNDETDLHLGASVSRLLSRQVVAVRRDFVRWAGRLVSVRSRG